MPHPTPSQKSLQPFQGGWALGATLLSLAFGVLGQAPLRAEALADAVIGKAGEIEVRLGEVSKNLETLSEAEREALRADPASLSQYVRAFLVQQLVLQEAAASGWEKSPVVTERLEMLRDGIVATTFLESIGTVPEGYPDETTLKAAYEENRESLREPKSWRLAQIFVSDPGQTEGATESLEAKAKRERVAAALAKPETDFSLLAMTESEEPESAARGGEIGWLPEPRIHPAIREVLPGMKLGDISEAVRMDDGWHFVRVLDIRESHIPTLAFVREALEGRLRQDYSQAQTEAFLSRLLESNPVAVDEVTVSKLLPPPDSD